MNPLIFLDIDGCLNHVSTPFDYPIDSFAVGVINDLIIKTGAKVVISSSWRENNGQEYNPTPNIKIPQPFNLKHYLVSQGITNNFHSDWMTPILKNQLRGVEVKAWLDKHPDISNYIIVDDVNEFTKNQQCHLILTNPNTGFSFSDYNKAISLLKDTK